MNSLHPPSAPITSPSWQEIRLAVASLESQAKAQTLCSDPECCEFGKKRASSCACANDPDADFAKALLSAAISAERAHHAHERHALNLQMNDQTGFYA